MANSAVVGLLRALLVADTAEFDKAMQRAGDSAKAWSKELKKIGSQAEAVGRTLTVGITGPLVALGGAASKLAIDFESSFAGVRKTVDGSEADFAQLSQQFRDLAKTIPVNVNQINALAESAGALGIPKEQLKEFVSVMAGLGTATNLTADEAATSIARIQNIFGAAGQHTDRFASTLVALGNAGASTEKEIVDMAARIAGAGHTVGLSQAQVLAFSSTLASVGINAEAGGSAMSRVLLKMNDAVSAGGAKLQGFAKVAGTTAAEFKRAFETDAAGATVTFVEGLQRIKEHGGNLSATLEPLIGKNIQLKDTMLRLAGAGELLQRDLTNANKAWADNTALQAETSKRYETTAAQLTILWNRLKDVGITIGQALLPSIKAMSEALAAALPYLEGFAKWFTDLPTGVQVAVIAIAGIAAAVGPALMAFGAMSSGLGTLVGAFKQGGIAATAFGATLTFLMENPIVLLIAGLGLLALAIYKVATAESATEKEIRSNIQAYTDHTKALDDSLATYDALKNKANLTAQEQKDLDAATRTLAEASGISVGQFQQETKESDALTKSLEAQAAARHANTAAVIDAAFAAKQEAAFKVLAAKQRLDEIKQGKASMTINTGEGSQDVAITSPRDIQEASDAQNKEIARLTKNLQDATAAYAGLTGVKREDIALADPVAEAARKAAAAAKSVATSAGEEETALTKAEKAAAKHAAEIEKTGRAISVGGVLDAMKQMTAEINAAEKSGGLAAESLERYGKQIEAWLQAGYKVNPVLGETHLKMVLLKESTSTTADAMKLLTGAGTDVTFMLKAQGAQIDAAVAGGKALADKYKEVAKVVSGDASKLLSATSGLNVKLGPPPKASTSFGASMGKDLAAQIPETMIRAFQGGGNVGKSVGATIGSTVASSAAKSVTPAITKAIGGGLGKAIGGLAGNAIPIVGPIIGAAVGGLIDKAFSHKGRDATVAFAESQGGFDELHKKLGTLGAEGEKMWVQLTNVGKKDEKGAQKIIDSIGSAFDAADKKAADAAAAAAERLQKLNDGFGRLSGALQVFGGTAPASLRPMIEELQKSTGLTAEMKSALAGMSQDPSWQTMQQKATDLGIDLAALGPKFQESKLTDIALGYARDLTMFADAGADMTGVVAGMSDELSTLYQDAMKNGVALPATLQPYMTKLVEMGKLVDENGDKVGDLNAVAFKDIEDKSLTDVVNVLKDIKDLLADALPKAAADGAAKIQDTFAKHPVTIPVQYGDPGAPPAPVVVNTPPPQIGLEGGTHGQFIDWGAGTDVTLHGRERVITAGEAVGGAGAAPIQITVVSQLDGKEVARNQVRYIPRALVLAGV